MFSSHRFNQSPLPIPPIGTERLGPTLSALSSSTESFTYNIDSFEATITPIEREKIIVKKLELIDA